MRPEARLALPGSRPVSPPPLGRQPDARWQDQSRRTAQIAALNTALTMAAPGDQPPAASGGLSPLSHQQLRAVAGGCGGESRRPPLQDDYGSARPCEQ